MTPRRLVAALVVVASTSVPLACGDGTPGFCSALEDQAQLDDLATALEDGDLTAADAEARRLRALADEAPEEIRSDFRELADAVIDVVDLLAKDRLASEATGDPDAVNPSEVERRREDLNDRFGELDARSERITTWARRECGIELT